MFKQNMKSPTQEILRLVDAIASLPNNLLNDQQTNFRKVFLDHYSNFCCYFLFYHKNVNCGYSLVMYHQGVSKAKNK